MFKSTISTSSQRESSIELLRILMMMCIVLYHMLGTLRDTLHDDSRILLFCYTILHVGVPVFILISGFFSIKLSFKRICGFYFYCVIWFIISYFAHLLIKNEPFATKVFLIQFLPFSNSGGHWFVPYYFTLMLFTPLLNKVDSLSQKDHLGLCVVLMSFMFYFDIISRSISKPGCSEIVADGHSLFYFVSLYLIGRYLNRIRNIIPKQCVKGWVLLVYLVIILALALVLPTNCIRPYLGLFFTYQSPVVIIFASYILVFFSRLKFSSRVINRIAASSFAIYLFHEGVQMRPIWTDWIIQNQYNSYGFSICLSLMFILSAIIVDQLIRIPLQRGFTMLMGLSSKGINKEDEIKK